MQVQPVCIGYFSHLEFLAKAADRDLGRIAKPKLRIAAFDDLREGKKSEKIESFQFIIPLKKIFFLLLLLCT